MVSQRRIVELVVVVLGPIKVFTVRRVPHVVILRVLNVEVRDPAELTIDITLLRHLSVVRHASAFDIVFLVGVKLTLWVEQKALLVLEVFVKVLLYIETKNILIERLIAYLIVLCVLLVEVGGRYMVAIVPVDVGHACIIGVVLNDLLLGHAIAAGVSEVAIRHVNQLVDILATEGSLTEVRGHRRSHLLEHHHVVF